MKKILIPFSILTLLLWHCRPKPQETTETPKPISLCGSPNSAIALKIIDTTRQIAPLMNNLGDYEFVISTTNKEAQKFFNQGLNLYYGFNHLEAYRSFREAARLDPTCAMCWWGQALSLGPNINSPMDPADAEMVYKAVRRAQANSQTSKPLEKGLIEAIAQRYTREAPVDRTPLDRAYADGMKKLVQQFPENNEAFTLCAEALMDLHPWDYWLRNGEPQPWTLEIVGHIEKVIKRSPKHPGANHLNIHIHEASTTPETALASADLLRDLIPGSGHLVHMPSHIYIRTGRYKDGIVANQKAVKADEDYISQCRAQGIYPLAYYPHNYHFYWACAQISGQGELSLKIARELVAKTATDLMGTPDWIGLQHYYVTPWYSMVRFRQWEELKKEPRPADSLQYALAIWNYARGMASLQTEDITQVKPYLDRLKSIASDSSMKNQRIWNINSFAQVLGIATKVLEGEYFSKQKKYKEAIAALEEAIQQEDALLYQEPADWYYPVREILGNVLLQAGKNQEAEKCFREDLKVFADNGWALGGLYRSLRAQGKPKEAAEVKKKFEIAFADADEELRKLE